MRAGFAQVRRRHHRRECLLDRARRIGQKSRNAGQGLVSLRIEDVEDGADQQRVRGFFPVIAALETAFGVDQHIRRILHVAHFPLASAHLQ
ncbi:hypothetical protein SSCI18S_00949 [Sphingobium scionense]